MGGFPGGSDSKASAYNVGDPGSIPGFNPWVRKISWRRKWQPTPVFLPGKSHGRENLVGYSPWDRRVGHNWSDLAAAACSTVGKESACSAGYLGSSPGSGRSPGEGTGNPFHYSCLENPMERWAWQAIAHGVARVRHDSDQWNHNEYDCGYTVIKTAISNNILLV